MQKDFGVIYINCSIEINKLPFYLPFCMDEILRHNKYTIRNMPLYLPYIDQGNQNSDLLFIS